MKLQNRALILLLPLLVSPTFASTPPSVPAGRLVPGVPAAPNPVPPLPVTGKVTVPPLTLLQLQASHFSGVVYHGMLSAFPQASGTLSTESGELETSASLLTRKRAMAPASAKSEISSAFPLLGKGAIKPDSAILGSNINVTADPPQDVEPSVISMTVNSADRTTSAYIKYDAVQTPRIHYASTTSFVLPFQNGTMPLPMNYNLTADPLMAENPYAGGVAQHRMYCAGIAYNNYSNPQNAANGIAVWHSDPADNGAWTAQPSIVDLRGPNYFVDKPSIAVSWHNGTDLGYVYVAYTSYDYVNNNSAIVVATSTDGGANFTVYPPVAYGGGPYSTNTVGNTQIVVDTNSGAVYVLWVDFGARQIQMATSSTFGSSFGAHEVAGTGIHTGTINGNLRAETVPMARYNWANSTIDLVWHADGTSGTDVEYAYRDFSGGGWHQRSQPVVQFTVNDQFMPALDFNRSGNVVLTYYDRHNDPQNLAYRAYEKVIYYWGDPVDTVDQLMGGDFSLVPSPGIGGPNPPPFIGDYQDAWDWTFADGEKATASWIGIPSGVYDMFLTRITY